MTLVPFAELQEEEEAHATSFLRDAEENGTGPDSDTVDDDTLGGCGAGGSRPDPSRPVLPSSCHLSDADNAPDRGRRDDGHNDGIAADIGGEVVHAAAALAVVGWPEMTRTYAKTWRSRWNPNDCDSPNPPLRNSRGAFPPAVGSVRQSRRS